MKNMLAATVMAMTALSAHAQAQVTSASKKELVQKILQVQQPEIEGLARSLVERPAAQMMQQAAAAMRDMPADKRDVVGKAIEADVKFYVDDAMPVMRDRAAKLSPSTIGATYEEKFTEDELKELYAWLSSAVNKKYQQIGPDMRNAFIGKLVADARPTIDPKVIALDNKIRAELGIPPEGSSAGASSAAGARGVKKSADTAPKPAKKQ